MVKEPKNIDFYTTSRQPSNEDFNKVSEGIKKQNKWLNPLSSKTCKTKAGA